MGKTNFIRKDPNDPLATFSAEELNAIYDAINNIEGALAMQIGTEDAEIPDTSIASLSAAKLLANSDASIRHLTLAGDLTVQGTSVLRGSVRLDGSALLTVKNASGLDIIKLGQYNAQSNYHGLVVTDGTNTNILVDDVGAVTVRGVIHALAGSSVTGNLSISGQIVSTVAQGTAPFVVASSTLVTNLNVDKIDGCDAGTAPNNVLKLDGSGLVPLDNIPSALTGKSADKLDDYHADTGTVASTIPVRDADGKVPGSITGDAHTVDGAHVGTGAGNVLLLDGDGLVPLGNIPGTLTGKSADKIGGKSLNDLVQNLGNTPSIQAGLEAGRPTAGVAGRLYIATDTKAWWRDTGTTWEKIVGSHASSHSSSGLDPITPAAIGAVSKSGDAMTGHLRLTTLSQGYRTTETYYPNVISDAQDTTVAGAWIIHTPIPRNSNIMFTIHVHGYAYGISAVIDFTFSGYAYSGSNGNIDGQPGAVVNYELSDNGTDGLPKYIGIDANGKVAVALGDHTLSAYYYRISVDAWITRTSTDYSTGWSIDRSTVDGFGWKDKKTATSQHPATAFLGAITVSGNTVWHAGNDGPGSGLVADKFDDLESTQFLRSDVDSTMAKKLHFSDTSVNPKLTVYSVSDNSTFTIIDKDARVWRAVYNDLAEFMPKLEEVEPGDVLAWHLCGVRKTRSASDKLVVGVYSDTFGFVLGGDSVANPEDNLAEYVPVAISGRVRVKAIGPVCPGDLLEASDIPGIARASMDHAPGTIIGKALEPLDDGLQRRIWMIVMHR